MTLTARDDDDQDPGETIDISVTHAGQAVGSASIRILDHVRASGPAVEITFQGLSSTHDPVAVGAASGPFTARFTFSEPVRGFSLEDVNWWTYAETTLHGTLIGILPWDFTEVRSGVEYSVRMMPTQNGRVSVFLDPGAATSVATGAASQYGHEAVRVEFPSDRILVAPPELTLEEGGANSAEFLVVLTSQSTGPVTVTTSGIEGTQVRLNRPTLTVEREYVTPEAAAAALFGESELTEEELSALDHLGNGNGNYDLGDLLSWIARCRRGEASCGGTSPGSRAVSAAALLAAAAAGRRGSPRRPRRRDSRARGRSPIRSRRRRGVAAYALAMLLSAAMTWSCTDDSVGPAASRLDPGFLTVELTVPPANRDIGVLLQLEGPGIETVRAPGLELYESRTPGQHQLVVAGALREGLLVQFQVPDRGQRSLYRVRLLQVTGEDYGLREAGEYQAVITN